MDVPASAPTQYLRLYVWIQHSCRGHGRVRLLRLPLFTIHGQAHTHWCELHTILQYLALLSTLTLLHRIALARE